MSPPQRRSGVSVDRIGDETVLRDPIANRVHVINASAAWVWDHLDGAATIEDIAAQLADRHGIDADVARRDVATVVDAFAGLDLLAGGG